MKIILLAATLSSSTLICSEPAQPKHHIYTPKTFWRTHHEGGYTYDTFGLGMEYTFHKPEGINVTFYGHSNFSDEKILLEQQITFSFNKFYGENSTIYPLFAFRSLSHKIGREDNRDLIVQKSIGSIGYGWKKNFSPYFELGAELKIFRDIHNSLYCQEKDKFWGKKFENPFGAGGVISAKLDISDTTSMQVATNYSRTFQECYWESGVEFTFNWGF